MWQWFLRAVQAAIFIFFVYGDWRDNWTNGRPIGAIFVGILFAFAATQGLMGLRWLWRWGKRRAGAKHLIE